MKILMASHYFSSHKGGVEIVADALYGALSNVDREVVWIAGDATPAPEAKDNSRAVALPVWNFVEEKTGVPFPIPTLGALRRILSELQNTDVILLHDCLYLCNIFVYLVAKWRGIPILIVQHTRFFPNSGYLMNNIIRFANAVVAGPMLSRASQVVFISGNSSNAFGHLKFKNPPAIIFNGVDTDLFRGLKDAETISLLRRTYNLPEERKVILFVGRFVEKKGIQAMRRMVEMRPQWTWAFAGWGSLDPTSWNAPNVKVYSNLWGDTMAALYRCCDLLVLPSSGEGFPLVLQEALATGIPAVCGTETLGADASMADFVRGAEVTVGEDESTARAFIAAIEETLSRENPSGEDALKRRIYAESKYSWHRSTERYIEILNRFVPVDERRSKAAAGKVSR